MYSRSVSLHCLPSLVRFPRAIRCPSSFISICHHMPQLFLPLRCKWHSPIPFLPLLWLTDRLKMPQWLLMSFLIPENQKLCGCSCVTATTSFCLFTISAKSVAPTKGTTLPTLVYVSHHLSWLLLFFLSRHFICASCSLYGQVLSSEMGFERPHEMAKWNGFYVFPFTTGY